MAKAEDVIKIAISEIGYKEKASNKDLDDKTANSSQPNNFTKYARDLDSVKNMYNGAKQGNAYCDIFNDWCHWMANNKDAEKTMYELCQPDKSAGAGCVYSYGYYKKAGRAGKEPKVGAQIFFTNNKAESGIHHTGIVEWFDKDTIGTLESNTSNMTARRTYKRNSSTIYGYGYPRYDVEPTGNGVNPNGTSKTASANASSIAVNPDINKLNKDTVKANGVVTADVLNVRTLPGASNPTLKSVPTIKKNTTVGVLDAVKADNGDVWYYILINGKTHGFVSSKYIKLNGATLSSSSCEDDSGKYSTR